MKCRGRLLYNEVTFLDESFPMTDVATAFIEKMNPSTGQLLASYPIARADEVNRVVHKSQVAAAQWANSTLVQRASLLRAIAKALYQQADALAELISLETGKPLSDAKESDLAVAIGILHYYADSGAAILKPHTIFPDIMSVLAGRSHQEVFSPRGVIGIIAPWNYPMAIPMSGIAAALMSGNAVVLKPSELTPGVGQKIVDVIHQVLKACQHPLDLVQLLIGDGSTGAALVESSIDGLIFTGSSAVGWRIAEQLSVRNLWYSLELGGSDAMILLDGCDLEKAASYAIWGRYTNAGQACASVKRLLVPEAHVKRFTQLLQCKLSQLKVGAPDEAGSHFGPLISQKQLEQVYSQVQDSIEQGAQLLAGGERLPRDGYFYAPTLLTQVPLDSRVLTEEVFGPVLPVVPYSSLDDAIEKANQTSYGLTASVFGPTVVAEQVAQRLKCGTVLINDIGASNYAMVCAPWSGWKQSGHGVSHGVQALKELSLRKIVSTNNRFHWPILGKPLWLFGKPGQIATNERSKAILGFAHRSLRSLLPQTWLTFWESRSSTRL